MAELVYTLAPDDRVDVLNRLDPSIVQELLALVSIEERRDILRLSSYPEGTAGAVMTSDVAKFKENMTVQQALDTLLHESDDLETVYYLYIVDDADRLCGLVSARKLISKLRRPQTPLGEIMERELVTVDVDDDQEVVADKVARYDLLAIPVVDDQHRMLGIITYDDVIDVVREEATEDAHRIGAVAPLEHSYLQTGLMTLSWKRGMWLAILFFGALSTAGLLRAFQQRLDSWPWLVMFIPLVISSGGNSGNQSATLIITALTAGDLRVGDWRQVLLRELLVGLVLGLLLGACGLMTAWLMSPPGQGLSQLLVVPASLVLVVLAGTLTGSLLPLGFRGLGWDPALMSNPFVAGIVDSVGIFIYMTVAGLILGQL
jgi:magnesium transporter